MIPLSSCRASILPPEHHIVVVLNKLPPRSELPGRLDPLALVPPEEALLELTFGQLRREDDAKVLVDGHEALVERAVVQGVEQQTVLGRQALGGRVGIAPWFDVAGHEQWLHAEIGDATVAVVVLQQRVAEVALVDACGGHDLAVLAGGQRVTEILDRHALGLLRAELTEQKLRRLLCERVAPLLVFLPHQRVELAAVGEAFAPSHGVVRLDVRELEGDRTRSAIEFVCEGDDVGVGLVVLPGRQDEVERKRLERLVV